MKSLWENPAFTNHRLNRKNSLFRAEAADRESFDRCLQSLQEEGCVLKEIRSQRNRCYAALQKESLGIFLTWFEGTRELRVVLEEDCIYFNYRDLCADRFAAPQITQIALEDSGMSYVIRLSDGRFLLLDGGCKFPPDAEKLYRCLREGTAEGERPIIAAWIHTHPHMDHYQCFLLFMEKYRTEVTVEKFLLNFPDTDDPAYAESFTYRDPRSPGTEEIDNLPLLWKEMEESGAEIHTPHTGQSYTVGDAKLEFLSCRDDVADRIAHPNGESLVFRMEFCGQILLWTGDAAFSIARLPLRYGTDLKADILQVPHHGFRSGDGEVAIMGYELIRPEVCLLPVSEYYGYYSFGFRDHLRHLMQNCPIKELIAGSVTRTLSMPYHAPEYAREEHLRKYEAAYAAAGARTWIFTDLSTDRPEDFVFELLNVTYLTANVFAELFFEEEAHHVRHIQFSLSRLRRKSLNVIGEEVDSEAVWFNEFSLKKQGIPSGKPFSIRFHSDLPIVISHKNHKDAYHG